MSVLTRGTPPQNNTTASGPHGPLATRPVWQGTAASTTPTCSAGSGSSNPIEQHADEGDD
ncbi:hypothetical protein ACX6XY_08485 [Streptomyces sp. O3]